MSLISKIIDQVNLVFFQTAYALQVGVSESDLGLRESGESTNFMEIVANVVKWALGFVGIIAVLMVVYSGAMMMISRGNEDQVGKAKKTLIAAVIGLIIIIMAYSIVSMVGGMAEGKMDDYQLKK